MGVGRRIAILLSLSALCAALLPAAARAMDLQRLIAPTDVCAGETDQGASVSEQEQAMRCMTNFARERTGLSRVGDAAELDRSAADKSGDILRCDSFSHEACGRQFTYWMGRVGYLRARCWRAGENIAWGSGDLGSVRSIFRAWIHSPEHRANILGRYEQIGIGLAVGRLDGYAGAYVWTQHFGSHCGAARPHSGIARLAAGRALG
jgi:uncharacterized protein YkwD